MRDAAADLSIAFGASDWLRLAICGIKESGGVLGHTRRAFESRRHGWRDEALIILNLSRRHLILHQTGRESCADQFRKLPDQQNIDHQNAGHAKYGQRRRNGAGTGPHHLDCAGDDSAKTAERNQCDQTANNQNRFRETNRGVLNHRSSDWRGKISTTAVTEVKAGAFGSAGWTEHS